jgi:hypothetical protein
MWPDDLAVVTSALGTTPGDLLNPEADSTTTGRSDR